MKNFIILILFIPVLYSCEPKTDLIFENIPTNSGPYSGESRLFSDGKDLYLSWISSKNDLFSLKYSKFTGNKWSEPILIIEDTDWFVNWADFPEIRINQNDPSNWLGYYLKKSNSETFSYDIVFIQSFDGGKNWSEGKKLHQDSTFSEHGFVSLFDSGNDFGAVWLDGRFSKNEDQSYNAMSLRAGKINQEGQVTEDLLLDAKTCDCCQTSAINTGSDVLVLYRDRTEEEIRDINIIRYHEGKWGSPEKFSHDNWKIDGCPVNGPAITAHGDLLAASWFTSAGDTSKVKLKISKNGGKEFSKEIRIDNGNPIGRIDALITPKREIIVSFIEVLPTGSGALTVKIFNEEGIQLGDNIAASVSISRDTGFPQMILFKNQLFISWTSVETMSIQTVKANIL